MSFQPTELIISKKEISYVKHEFCKHSAHIQETVTKRRRKLR